MHSLAPYMDEKINTERDCGTNVAQFVIVTVEIQTLIWLQNPRDEASRNKRIPLVLYSQLFAVSWRPIFESFSSSASVI